MRRGSIKIIQPYGKQNRRELEIIANNNNNACTVRGKWAKLLKCDVEKRCGVAEVSHCSKAVAVVALGYCRVDLCWDVNDHRRKPKARHFFLFRIIKQCVVLQQPLRIYSTIQTLSRVVSNRIAQ